MKRLFSFGWDIMERLSKRKKVAQENYFERLPDELVVLIFEKVSEVKSLCMCYMVSRRFASLVVQSHVVSFKCPITAHQQERLDGSSTVDNFFKKFVSIQSLHLQLTYGIFPGGEYIFKWNAIGYQKSFILLVVNRGRVIAAADNDDKPEVGATIPIDPRLEQVLEKQKRYLVSIIEHILRTRYWLLSKIILYWGFSNLKEVVVTDSLNLGRLFIADKTDIDTLRMSDPMTITPTVSKVWAQPVVKLPLSGSVVEDALLAICKSSIDIDDVSIAQHAFQEEKEVCEAAMELLKRKPVYDSRPRH